MIPLGNYQKTGKLVWTAEGFADSKILEQELHLSYRLTDWEGGAKETLSAG
jgi:hypothetical protein